MTNRAANTDRCPARSCESRARRIRSRRPRFPGGRRASPSTVRSREDRGRCSFADELLAVIGLEPFEATPAILQVLALVIGHSATRQETVRDAAETEKLAWDGPVGIEEVGWAQVSPCSIVSNQKFLQGRFGGSEAASVDQEK